MRKYSDFFKTLHDETSPTGYLGRGTHYSVLRAVVFHGATGKPLPEAQLTDFAVIWDEDHDARVIEPIEEIYRRGLLASFLMFGERKGSFTAILSNKVSAAIEAIPFNLAFLSSVDELEFSVIWTPRILKVFKDENIFSVGDLVQKSEDELLRLPNVGRKLVNELKEVLAQTGLCLGMEVPGWSEHIEGRIKDKARIASLGTEINAICQSLNDPWPSEVVTLESAKNPIISDEDGKVSLYLKNLEMLWQLGTVAKRPKKPATLVTADGRRIVQPQRPTIDADGNLPGWTTDPSEADRGPFHS